MTDGKPRRPLEQLVDNDEPGMELVRSWADDASNEVEILPGTRERGEQTLMALQVTTRSPMGAIAYETGGILIDHGWLRVLGGRHQRLPRDLATWNRISAPQAEHRLPGALLVADDILGGFFALNGGGLPGQRFNVFYLQPDAHAWLDLNRTYSQWLHWAMHGDLNRFWDGLRWPGWQPEVAAISGDKCLSIYPPLGFERTPVGDRDRRAVPIEELWGLAVQLERELNGLPDGAKVVFKVVE